LPQTIGYGEKHRYFGDLIRWLVGENRYHTLLYRSGLFSSRTSTFNRLQPSEVADNMRSTGGFIPVFAGQANRRTSINEVLLASRWWARCI